MEDAGERGRERDQWGFLQAAERDTGDKLGYWGQGGKSNQNIGR